MKIIILILTVILGVNASKLFTAFDIAERTYTVDTLSFEIPLGWTYQEEWGRESFYGPTFRTYTTNSGNIWIYPEARISVTGLSSQSYSSTPLSNPVPEFLLDFYGPFANGWASEDFSGYQDGSIITTNTDAQIFTDLDEKLNQIINTAQNGQYESAVKLFLTSLAPSSGWIQENRILVRSYSVIIDDHDRVTSGHLKVFVDDSHIKFYFVATNRGDGNPTESEIHQYTYTIPNSVTTTAILGSRVLDTDEDGVADSDDAFPNDPTEVADFDGDLIGNNSDTDDDDDGVLDSEDAFPFDASEWLDTDGDLIGNNTDTDDDGDSLSDIKENTFGSDPLVTDTYSSLIAIINTTDYSSMLTLDEVKDLRAGSTMIEVESGTATLSMEVEQSDDLEIWTNGGASTLQIPIDAEAGKKFFRFKMSE